MTARPVPKGTPFPFNIKSLAEIEPVLPRCNAPECANRVRNPDDLYCSDRCERGPEDAA
jgi:hypothetical protein